jgi:hypothetical protein
MSHFEVPSLQNIGRYLFMVPGTICPLETCTVKGFKQVLTDKKMTKLSPIGPMPLTGMQTKHNNGRQKQK